MRSCDFNAYMIMILIIMSSAHPPFPSSPYYSRSFTAPAWPAWDGHAARADDRADEKEKNHKSHSHSSSHRFGAYADGDARSKARHKRGENAAWAFEAVLTCFLTDFIDPVLMWHMGKKDAEKHGYEAHGTLAQNVIGEVGGDLFSAVALVGAEELFPNQMKGFSKTLGSALDPVYSRMAEYAVKDDCPPAERAEKIKEWKEYQEDNLAKSVVMAAAGIGGNIALQKSPLVGNPSPASVIFKGKLAGVGLTTALVLGSRLAFPKQTKAMDAWLGDHVFTPILDRSDRFFGVESDRRAEKEGGGRGI